MCYIKTKRVVVINATFNTISVTIYISLTKILQDTTLCYIQEEVCIIVFENKVLDYIEKSLKIPNG